MFKKLKTFFLQSKLNVDCLHVNIDGVACLGVRPGHRGVALLLIELLNRFEK